MSTLRVIRGGIIGATAVVAPSLALGVTVVSIVLRDWKPYLGLLGVTYLLVGALAWACVRLAHFSPRRAVFLTTFPFGVAALLTLGALVTGEPGGFLICGVQLALAVFLARAAATLGLQTKR